MNPLIKSTADSTFIFVAALIRRSIADGGNGESAHTYTTDVCDMLSGRSGDLYTPIYIYDDVHEHIWQADFTTDKEHRFVAQVLMLLANRVLDVINDCIASTSDSVLLLRMLHSHCMEMIINIRNTMQPSLLWLSVSWLTQIQACEFNLLRYHVMEPVKLLNVLLDEISNNTDPMQSLIDVMQTYDSFDLDFIQDMNELFLSNCRHVAARSIGNL